ncbi:PAS domain-containing protein [Flavobacterium sp.]|uniref:PAS domain-containing protein n=1 Tax=Flavobacterium sp. TaxID=239 RepID=UPI0025BF9E0D|nr:PAS domain-containing protein [Flavobacterium sp.]
MPCYLFSFSNDGTILRINRTFLTDLGYSAGEVVGKKKLEQLLTVGSRIFFQTHFYPLIKMQKKANEIFLSFLTKQGDDIPVLLNVVVAECADKIEMHCGGMQISRRNQFERELLEAKNILQKALDENAELIATRDKLKNAERKLEKQLQKLHDKSIDQIELNKVLTHDLQEPLRKVNLFSSKLLLDLDPNIKPESFEALQKITVFVDRVRQLLDSLNKFNSLDSMKMAKSKIDFAEIVDVVIKKHSIDASKAIHFTGNALKSSSGAVFVSDFKLLVDLFDELIKNAQRFDSADLPNLKFRISTDVVKLNVFSKNESRFQYEDRLRIIFEENCSRNYGLEANAFQLFKLSNLVVDELGVGLSYCRRIVQILGGDIVVSPKEIGAVFTITFPLE